MDNLTTQTLTQALVSLIRNRSIEQQDLDQAALLVLDAVASAIAGSSTPVGKKLLSFAMQEPINTRTQAFLIGALMHITETDDLHRDSVTHPGCIVVPVTIATALQAPHTSHAVLKAVIHGYEAVCRVGHSVGPGHYVIWHNTATCGPFGSAMAVAELLELSDEQTVLALGNAGTQSSGLWQFLESGSMSKHLHAGRGAEAGLLAAQLAAHDFTGAADILEGEKGFYKGLCSDADPSRVLAKPQQAWAINNTSIKPWPSCRHTHPSIDAAREIHSQLGNRIIDNVSITTYQSALDICDRSEVANEYQAKFSLQHCTATALLNGDVGLGDFDGAGRERTADLRARTSVVSGEPFKSRYPEAWGARVVVTTTDGTSITVDRDACKGDPELPLPAGDMKHKAVELMRYAGLPQAEAERISTAILALSEPDADVGIFADLWQLLIESHRRT